MRSKTILSSICISALILIFATTHTNQNKYLIPENIKYHTLAKPAQKQVECLAQNMMYEAGFEPREGQIAVALVTLNRVASGNYASDVCGVVKQKTTHNGRTVCQFSWVCEHNITSKNLTERHYMVYNEIKQLAIYVMMNYETLKDNTKGATYYHADYVNPHWNLPKTTKIGRHIFYKKHSDIININKEIKL